MDTTHVRLCLCLATDKQLMIKHHTTKHNTAVYIYSRGMLHVYTTIILLFRWMPYNLIDVNSILVQGSGLMSLGNKPVSEPMLRNYCDGIWCPQAIMNNWKAAPSVVWYVHYNGVIMSAMVSQITSLTIVYSSVYSDADQRKHQSSA